MSTRDSFLELALDRWGHDVTGPKIVVWVEQHHRAARIHAYSLEVLEPLAPAHFRCVEVQVKDGSLRGGLAQKGLASGDRERELKGKKGLPGEGLT